MKNLLFACLLSVFLCLSIQGQAPRPMTFDDIMALKTVANTAISPDGKFIAYTVSYADMKENERRTEIWMVAANGGQARRFTYGKNDTAPQWSPDGTRIAFASQASGNLDIYIMETSGSQRRRLTYHSRNSLSPSWSPDGMYIAFVFEGFNGYEIHVVGADGSGERRISYAGVAGSTPLWLP